MSIVLVGFGNHTQNKLIPALINLKIPITAIITNNKNCKLDIPILSGVEKIIDKKQNQKFIISHVPKNHFQIIKDLQDINASILVEKPAFVSVSDYKLYSEIIGKTKVTEGMMYRFGESLTKIKNFYLRHNNKIEEIKINFTLPISFQNIMNNFRGNYLHKNSIIYEIGCYIFDLIWCLDLAVKSFKLKKTEFFSNEILKNLEISSTLRYGKKTLKLKYTFGYGANYKNYVRVKARDETIMIEPFFWGRSGKINHKFTAGENFETYNFYQKNLYEEMIYSWFYNKNISILDDLNNIERFSFIINNLEQIEKRIY